MNQFITDQSGHESVLVQVKGGEINQSSWIKTAIPISSYTGALANTSDIVSPQLLGVLLLCLYHLMPALILRFVETLPLPTLHVASDGQITLRLNVRV